MPSDYRDRYRELLEQQAYSKGYDQGYRDGLDRGFEMAQDPERVRRIQEIDPQRFNLGPTPKGMRRAKPKRKLSKWQKFVKANSKKKKFIYQSGPKKGKLNLKKMGVAYRRSNK